MISDDRLNDSTCKMTELRHELKPGLQLRYNYTVVGLLVTTVKPKAPFRPSASTRPTCK